MNNNSTLAIVGIGCRFPGGANSPEKFWQLLRDGADVISEIPVDRWNIDRYYDTVPGMPGKSCTRWGGFIENIDRFDPHFFNISPREAVAMDPQQRLLLETAWEALEDGGHVLDPVQGTDMGTFIGISHNDYSLLQSTPNDRTTIDVYTPTGSAHSIAANRISYVLNLRGPSLAVDTACSSALTAVHLACQSIWCGECRLALAGGVNVIINPDAFIGFSLASMLSPDGRCFAFDSRANGFVRAEGAGVILLKPLEDALADNDRIYATILGSAVNQDGHSKGLTVPNSGAQEALVREACRRGGVEPYDINYVEAHGTGTPVGDPLEIEALGRALSPGRNGQPCLVGSVKTNIGHLESAAGIAGLIKTALALKHGMVPPHLHFNKANPELHLEDWKLEVCSTLRKMPRNNGRALAGVNSFGFGGANAHVVLAEPPRQERLETNSVVPSRSSAYLLPLSARSSDALHATASKWCDFLQSDSQVDSADLRDICYTAGLRRRHHEHRLSVIGRTKSELAERLSALLKEEPDKAPREKASSEVPQVVFVFSGQGPQWWAMGRELLQEEPVFREAIARCDKALSRFATWSLHEELMASESESRLDRTEFAQPAIFAVQVALARLWQSWGITASAVVGHSVGEVAAAHIAGALTLADAASVIVNRGRCMENAQARGRMLAAGLSAEEAYQLADVYEGIFVAAINAPASVTLSGNAEELEEVADDLQRKNVFCRFVRVEYPFHTPFMEPAACELESTLSNLSPCALETPIYSTVTGEKIEGEMFHARHWADSVRQPVLFGPTVDELIEDGYSTFLELSAHPALLPSIRECLHQKSVTGTVLQSLRQREPETESLLGSLAVLYALGCPVSWVTLVPGGRCVRVPTYAWQQDKYWHESAESNEARLTSPPHPLLGRKLSTAEPRWEIPVSTREIPYLADHEVRGRIVFPAAGYVEMALGAAREILGDVPCVLEEVEIQSAMLVNAENEATRVQLSYQPENGLFEIDSRASETATAWNRHARGKFRKQPDGLQVPDCSVDDLLAACPEEISSEEHYQLRADRGIHFGASFRTVQQIWRGDDVSFAQVEIPEHLNDDVRGYRIHPVLLDAAFQIVAAALPKGFGGGRTYLPVGMRQLRYISRPSLSHYCVSAEIVRKSDEFFEGNARIYDENGEVIFVIDGLRCQAVEGTATEGEGEEWLWDQQWRLKALSQARPPCRPSDYLPDMSGVEARLREAVRRGTEQQDSVVHEQEIHAELDRLCRAYIRRALSQLGWQPQTGDRITAKELLTRCRIAGKYQLLLERFLSSLTEDGQLARDGDDWTVLRAAPGVDIQLQWRLILSRCPAAYPVLTLIAGNGDKLAEILTGETNPLEVTSAETAWNTLEHMYGDSWTYRPCNQLAGEAVVAALEALPEGRRLRILEIGAGTGGMTSFILPHLPPGQVEYVFSDVSASVFAPAEQRFQDHDGLIFQVLDIDQSPVDQGFEPRSFDLVIASDVFHATKEARRTLAHVQELLAPSGMLFFFELTRPNSWADIVFGVTDPWWRYEDRDLRCDGPLLSRDHWESLLQESGFSDVCSVSSAAKEAETRHVLFLARGPQLSEPTEVDPVLSTETGKWLIFADRGGAAAQLAEKLENQNSHCLLVFAGENLRWVSDSEVEIRADNSEDFLQLCVEVGACQGVIHMWSLDTPDMEMMDVDALLAAERWGCLSVLHLSRALNETQIAPEANLWLVTRWAQPAGNADVPVSPPQAALIGLGRVIANEQPKLNCRLVDLGDSCDDEIAALMQELAANDGESEVALRGEARYVQRIVRGCISSCPPNEAGQHEDFRLETLRSGLIDNLVFRACPRRTPGPGEVSIEVSAVALNFRDVMKALGVYPTEVGDAGIFGDECFGHIVEVGANVKDLAVGDAVLAFGGDCFASRITVPAMFVFRKPPGMTGEEATTLPVTFLTAHYALHHLGRICKGERVLIQSAAGGVGLASMQIALHAGAEVFATAGSEEKRDLVRRLGATHVMDSRSLEFADHVRQHTNGEGVDLVLNSLAGEAIAKGLETLRPFGRFLEIGKRDIFQNRGLAMRVLRNNISFFAIDLGQAMIERPEFVRSQLDELNVLFTERKLHPLPLRVFSAANVRDAFRNMERAKHMGKIVVSMKGGATPDVAPAKTQATAKFPKDETILITGGLGGFGLAVARWMVEQGARNLLLAGRSGASTAEAKTAVSEMEQLGARVVVASCDVASTQDVRHLLDMSSHELPPLRGVVHMAMVIDDNALVNLTNEKFARVTAPKTLGVWNLHVLTRDMPLDFFVMFSSGSSVVGNPGQGNYAAANAFLDAMAHHRRAHGLPALSINWGALGEVGYVAQHQKVGEILSRQGIQPLSTRQATHMLGRLLPGRLAQIAVMPLDWRKFADVFPHIAHSPRFSEQTTLIQHEPRQAKGRIRDAVLMAPLDQRQSLMTNYLVELVAKVVCVEPDEIDPTRPLFETALDSLMGIELVTLIESDLHVPVSPSKLLAGQGIDELASDLLDMFPGMMEPVEGVDMMHDDQPSDAKMVID